jgi:hypothetical protein
MQTHWHDHSAMAGACCVSCAENCVKVGEDDDGTVYVTTRHMRGCVCVHLRGYNIKAGGAPCTGACICRDPAVAWAHTGLVDIREHAQKYMAECLRCAAHGEDLADTLLTKHALKTSECDWGHYYLMCVHHGYTLAAPPPAAVAAAARARMDGLPAPALVKRF